MRTKIICGVLALVMISAGLFIALRDADSSAGAVVVPPNSNLVSTIMDKPANADPTSVDAKQALYIAAGELKRSGGFRASSIGASTSMGVSQGVASERTVVGNNAFKQSTSYSSLVKFGEQLLCWDENYLSRSASKVHSLTDVSWENKAYKYTADGWLHKIGYRNTDLTGYILNDETILSANLVSEENGLYTFRYALDTEIAPYYVLFEMKNNSGAKGFASFLKAEIVVVMDSNFVVQTLTTDCEYRVPLMGGVNCKESLTETFFDIGYNGELPQFDFFKDYFNAEVVDPSETQGEPSALDVLMSIFEPYIAGQKLNVALNADLGGTNVNALVSANIDIKDLNNLTADVKLGDLLLSYAAGSLFVTYQDFRASTTVDGIMGFVDTLMPLLGVSGGLEMDIDPAELLGGLSYRTENGVCTVSLPLELAGICADIQIVANVANDNYTLVGATVNLDKIAIDIVPVDQWDMPERVGDYPEILGLTKFLDNGVISVKANVFGFDADIMFDVATTSLYLKSGDIFAALVDNTVFVTVGEAKVKFELNDIDKLLEILAPFVGEGLDMPEISLDEVLTAVSNIRAQQTDNGVGISLALDSIGLKAYLALIDENNSWILDSISVEIAGIALAIEPSERFVAPEIGNKDDFVDVTAVAGEFVPAICSLIDAKGFAASIDGLTLQLGEKTFVASGDILFDQNKNLQANVDLFDGTVCILQAEVIYANDTVFVAANGIKLAFGVGGEGLDLGDVDLTALPEMLGLDKDLVDGLVAKVNEIVAAVKGFDISKLDLGNLVETLAYNDGALHLVANGEIVSLGKIDVTLAAVENGLAAKLEGFQFASVTVDLAATVTASNGLVVVPDAADYVLNLTTEIAGIGIDLSVNVANMDIWGQVSVFNDVVDVRFVDGVVYAQLGNVKVKLALTDALALLGNLNLDMGEGLDLAAILGSLKLDLTAAKPQISLDAAGIAVAVNFVRNNGEIAFDGVDIAVGGQNIAVKLADKPVAKLDIDQKFVDIAPVVNQVVALVKSFGDTTGVAAELDAEIVVDQAQYFANVSLQYCGGLHIAATVGDSVSALVEAQIDLVDGVLYIDANDVRAALKLDALGGGKISMDGLKGYSKVLDSVLDAVEYIMANYKSLKLADVVETFDCENGVLGLGLDGTSLGLGKFGVALDLATPSVVVDGLTLGGVVASLDASVAACNQAVVAPQGTFTTQLQVALGDITVNAELDLLNMRLLGNLTWKATTADLAMEFESGTIYVVCGGAKLTLALDDIDGVLAEIGKIVDLGDVSIGEMKLDVAEILNSITLTHNDHGFVLGVNVAGIDISAAFSGTTLTSLGVNVFGMDIAATPTSGVEFAEVGTEGFVNALDLLKAYCGEIAKLVTAENFNISANGTLVIDEKPVAFDVKILFGLDGNVWAKAALSYDELDVVDAEIWMVGGTLYANVDGISIAVKLPASTATAAKKSLDETLAPIYGYNKHLDNVLNVVKSVVAKATALDFDIYALIGGLTFANNTIALNIDAKQFGLNKFDVTVANNNGLAAAINKLVVAGIAIDLNATVVATEQKVVAPTGNFKTQLKVTIGDIVANVELDLLNMRLLGNLTWKATTADFAMEFESGTIYVVCGGAKLALALDDIDGVLAEIGKIVDLGDVSMGEMKIDIASILNSLKLAATEEGFDLGVNVTGIDISAAFSGTTLASLSTSVLGLNIAATPTSGVEFAEVGTEGFVNALDLLKAYCGEIATLISAKNFDISANGTIAADNITIGFDAQVLFGLDGNVWAKALLSYDKAKVVDAQIWLVGETLYATVDGINLAINLPAKATSATAAKKSLAETLAPFYGYNKHVDDILKVVENVYTKAVALNFDIDALIGGLTFANNTIALNIDATQFGLGKFDVAVSAGNGLAANIGGLVVKGVAIDLAATVAATEQKVVVPALDWTTNVAVQLDENNKLYGRLDILGGDYTFELEHKGTSAENPMFVNYNATTKTLKIKKGTLCMSVNIDEVVDIVKYIDTLVDQFSGNDENNALDSVAGVLSKLNFNIDLKALVNSLQIEKPDEDSVKLALNLFGFDTTALLKQNENGAVIDNVTVSLTSLGIDGLQTIVLTPDVQRKYCDFDKDEYVQLDQVLRDYLGTEKAPSAITNLVNTNSWKFTFGGEGGEYSEISLGKDKVFGIGPASYVLLYYNNMHKDDFMLRAYIELKKLDGNKWIDFVNVDVVLKADQNNDLTLYVTYDTVNSYTPNYKNSNMKIAVKVDTLGSCISMINELTKVIPQIGDLLDKIGEAGDKIRDIDYSTLVTAVSYNKETSQFALGLNLSPLIDALGAIDLTVSKTDSTMTLNSLSASFGDVSIHLKSVTVAASELTNVEEPAHDYDKYTAAGQINSYFAKNSVESHMNFDSLQALMLSLIDTAGNNSFAIDGTVNAQAKILGIEINVDIQVGARVDIVRQEGKDDVVFVTVKLDRGELGTLTQAAFADRGGCSYLFYNGATNTIRIIRDSMERRTYCSACNNYSCDNGWHTFAHSRVNVLDSVSQGHYSYDVTISAEEFGAHVVDYILPMVNFIDLINQQITKENTSTNVFGIEDVFKSYSYSNKTFAVTADLAPVNSALGELQIEIAHTNPYKVPTTIINDKGEEVASERDYFLLTTLKGKIKLVSLLNCTFDIKLQEKPTWLDATYFVENSVYWNTSHHVPQGYVPVYTR